MLKFLPVGGGQRGGGGGHHLTGRVPDFGFQAQGLEGVAGRGHLRAELHLGKLGVDFGRGEVGAPHRNVHGLGHNQVHVAVEAGAGVPARGFGLVLQAHGQRVAAIGLQKIGDVEGKRVVAVGPGTHFPAVHENVRVAHGPVEEQHGPPARPEAGHR